jgi:hypothetical protein
LTNCIIPLDDYDRITQRISSHLFCIIAALACCYGLKVLHYFVPVVLTIVNVWFLARLYDDIDISYQVDVFTIYFLVWQFSYPICQWSTHQLSWPILILQQGSMCLFPVIVIFLLHENIFRYYLSIELAIFWIIAFADM